MTLTIDDLLNSLQNPNKPSKTSLTNSKDNWNRIGNKDSFSELGLEPSELDSFLQDWIKNNPYENL